MENKVDSVLFDLDGTLWDAVPVIFRVIQDLFREYSSVPAADTTLDDVYAYMGLQTWDIMKLCFPEWKMWWCSRLWMITVPDCIRI